MLRRQIPSTNALFTFEAVARLNSFSHAAKELNVTQPAVSRSINSLEEHLGYSLFERHGRWIKLTQNGDKLYRATSTAFSTISDSIKQIGQQTDNFDVITISMSAPAVNYWFIPRMQEFKQEFPNISLDFVEHRKESDSFSSHADLSIRLSHPVGPDQHRWPFADEAIVALCSPQYLETHGSLEAAKPSGFWMPRQPHTFIEWSEQRFTLDEFFTATNLQLPDSPRFIKYADYSSILQSTILGQGIALAWVTEVSKQIIDKTLVPACSQVITTGRNYHILASNLTPLRPAVKQVRDWLINKMQQDQERLNTILKHD